MKRKEIVEPELELLTNLIPGSKLIMTTRYWQPWRRFVNNIEDMNPQELEKIISEGEKTSR